MIREALIDDIDKIYELGNLLNTDFSKTYDLSFYIESDNYLVLVNDDNNKINAFLIVLKGIDSLDIEVIYVQEDSRRKGIATNLLFFLINNYATDKKAIFLEVAVNNNKAIALYKKMEFEIVNVRKKYYENIDAYVMRKVIR